MALTDTSDSISTPNRAGAPNPLHHLLLLWALAVAQPLFDLINQNPEFLVAHALEGPAVILFTIMVSFVPPLLLSGLIMAANRGVPTIAAGLFYLVFVMLVALALLPPAKGMLGLDGAVAVGAVFLAAVVAALIYQRAAGVRQFFSLFSLAAVVFPLYFLLTAPVWQMLFPSDPAGASVSRSLNGTPVVFVVLDEFPVLSLVDRDLNIDDGRFPNFTQLAEEGVWYRYHTTHSINTLISIPTMLSGVEPFGVYRGVPTSTNFPHNLFTLLSAEYEMSVTEHGTRLCPAEICEASGFSHDRRRYKQLAMDSLIVLAHLCTPLAFADLLPSISHDWAGFGGGDGRYGSDQSEPKTLKDALKTVKWGDRIGQFRRFVEQLESGSGKLFYFHGLLPHAKWNYLPDGRTYAPHVKGETLGIKSAEPGARFQHQWHEDAAPVRLARQRHLLQVGLTDTLIGELVEKLRQIGSYDETLIVITSDHGASFAPGGPRRSVFGESLVEIAGVPLFIKYPGGTVRGISELNAQGKDILPTVMDVLGGSRVSGLDGVSLISEGAAKRPVKTTYNAPKEKFEVTLGEYKHLLRAAAVESVQVSGSGDIASIFTIGDDFGVIGKSPQSVVRVDGKRPPQITLKNEASFGDYDPDADHTPLLLIGEFTDPAADFGGHPIAVSINGRVAAVSAVFQFGDQRNHFQVLLPPSELRRGDNLLAVWMIAREQGRTVLRATAKPGENHYVLIAEADGSTLLSDGESLWPVEAGAMTGWSTAWFSKDRGTVKIGGWAADLHDEVVADRVIAFVNGRYHAAVTPSIRRPKTAQKHSMPTIERSGFRILVPLDGEVPVESLEVRLFALGRSGRLSELNYPAPDSKKWPFLQRGDAIPRTAPRADH